ncbi:hypothetical protein [Aureimonas glaciei]|uniref:Uncharacterized protein n=1 Tax=Aureimonas glaciei TaxID=1776957 RepID=A0A916XU40_9HYPH|nr:hypothetical protein [Aureimonas glaciei]GGD10615.1 hypothetical protein GCM10011335_11890 [Aureimonas glaciei]
MYRLICPAVDAACAANGLEAYFEYSRPNGPNRRLSADIALLRDGQPIWLIEAKKYGRRIEPGMVDSYLIPGVMGVVSNGNHWIFKIGGRYLDFGPLLRADGTLDREPYDAIVSLLSATDEATAIAMSDAWSDTWTKPAKMSGPVPWVESGGKGERRYHQKTSFSSLVEAAASARSYVKDGTMAAAFLDEIISENQEISAGHVELNQARMIWWLTPKVRRIRLNLTGQHMEMLVHNTVLEAFGRGKVSASIKLHDKNTAMSIVKASIPEEVEGLSALFGPSSSA